MCRVVIKFIKYKDLLDSFFKYSSREFYYTSEVWIKRFRIFAGAAAASRMYVDAISKLARQAQQGTWGGSSDIGKSTWRCI